jgi:hypothetical protein
VAFEMEGHELDYRLDYRTKQFCEILDAPIFTAFFYTRLKGVFYTFIFGASIIGGEKIIGFMNSIPG